MHTRCASYVSAPPLNCGVRRPERRRFSVKRVELEILLFGSLMRLEASAAETTSIRCGRIAFSVFNSHTKESPFFVLTVAGLRTGTRYYPLLVVRDYLKVRCEITSA